MTLFLKDWHKLKNAVKRAMFNSDLRYQRMTYEQAKSYLDAELKKLTIPELEAFITKHGIEI